MTPTENPVMASPMRRRDTKIAPWSAWQSLSRVAYALGVVGMIVAFWFKQSLPTRTFYASYLTASWFWLSLGLGALFFVLLHHVTRASWSVVFLRLAENVMATLPTLALVVLPFILWGSHSLYPWAHRLPPGGQDLSANLPPTSHALAYTSLFFWQVRAIFYLLTWSASAIFLSRRSTRQDNAPDSEKQRTLWRAVPPLLILYGLTQTFAAMDWIMALAAPWTSTIFGVYAFAGSTVAIFAFLAVISVLLRASRVLDNTIGPAHYHDMGRYLFAALAFWAYITFSQRLIISYANIPAEMVFLAQRQVGTWATLGVVLALLHFVFPFFFLLPRENKRRPKHLIIVALILLVAHYLDIYRQIMPAVLGDGVEFSLLDLAIFVGVGGFFLGSFASRLCRHPLVPLGDPRLPESIAHGETSTSTP